jgi:hypothetical protein
MRPISFALLLLAATLACSTDAPIQPADLVVHNAVIYTVNESQPRAEAVAVRGGRFVVVGSNADAMKLIGTGTRVVDAGGKTVVPGCKMRTDTSPGLGKPAGSPAARHEVLR